MRRIGLILALLFILPAQTQAAIFYLNGYEVGTHYASEYAAGTGGGTPVVDNTHVRSGAYSLKLPTTSDFVAVVGVGGTETWLRLGIWRDACPAADGMTWGVADSTNTTGILVGIDTACKIFWKYTPGGAKVATSTHAISTGAWNLVEIHAVRSLTVGGAEVKLNGVTEFTSFGTNTNSITFNRWILGTATGGMWIDDVCMSNSAYCGDGHIIARQGTSGTPTYNTWTKNSCTGGTIDGCWSDTPASATSNATTTSAQKQTMKVARFSATQTGHGSEVIRTNATINGVVVYSLGKKLSGTTAVGNQITIIGGVETESSGQIGTSTSDIIDMGNSTGFQHIWSATAAQLDTMEVGVDATTVTSATLQIEDMWVYVDYLGGVAIRHRVIQE